MGLLCSFFLHFDLVVIFVPFFKFDFCNRNFCWVNKRMIKGKRQ